MLSPLPLDPVVTRQRWQFLRAELRWAYCGTTSPQHGKHWFFTPYASAWLLLQGTAQVRTTAGQCGATPGQWLIAPSGERWQQTSTDCRLLSISFFWRWIFGPELFPLPRALKLPADEVPGLRTMGFRLARKQERLFPGSRNDLPQRSSPIPAHLELQTDFSTWLGHYCRAMKQLGVRPSLMTLDPRIEEAVQILDCPGGFSMRPAALAKQLGVSRSQMNRLFLRHLGKTVRGYTEQQKFMSARILLTGSHSSVKEIAFRLGFISPQHFARWFRKHSGVSPTQLRQANVPMI